MLIVLRLALFLVAAMALLCYLGYGPTRLLVSDDRRQARWLLLPVLGFCVLAAGASFLTYLLPIPATLVVLVALATAGNLWLVRRDGGLALGRPGRAELAVAALAIVAYGVASLPQIHAGSLAFLGVQWDLEIYLPLSEYLKRYAMGAHLSAYPNPLLDMMNDPAVRGGSGWGFMYLDSSLGALLGWPSFESFPASLHLAFALSAPAVFALCRWGFRMGAAASVTAAALAAANGVNLWVAAIGLGGHALAFALLPTAVLGVLWTVRQPDWRNAIFTGLAVTGLVLSFYTGAAAVLAAAAAPMGLYGLWPSERRKPLLLAAAWAAGALLLLGAVAHLRLAMLAPQYFRDGFSEGWKTPDFVSLSQAAGFVPHFLVQQRLEGQPYLAPLPPEAVALWATGLSVAVLGLCGLALLRSGWERWPWLAGVLGLAAFAAVLRWGAPYPYGYFKVFSLGSFMLTAGVAQGLAALASAGWRGFTVPRRAVAAGLVLAAVPLLAANMAQSLRYFWEPDPDELPRSVWELTALREHVPVGAPVYVTGRSGFEPRLGAMVGYFLMDNPVVGNLKSAYGAVRSPRPDEPFDYLLFQAGERPETAGVQPDDLVWRNNLVALYRRPEAWTAFVDLESAGEPLVLNGAPLRLSLEPGAWSLSSERSHYQGTDSSAAPRQQVEMTLLAADTVPVTVDIPGGAETLRLPAGMVMYRTAPVAAPGTLTLDAPAGGPAVRLLGLRVLEAGARPQALEASQDLLVLEAAPAVNGGHAQVDISFYANDSNGGHTALAVEFYRRGRSGLEPAGFTQLALAKRPETAHLQWQTDLSDARCSAEAGPPQPRADGDYEAHLAVYHVNEEVLRRRWLRFTVAGGRVTRTQPDVLPPYLVQYMAPPREIGVLARSLPPGAVVLTPAPAGPDGSFVAAASKTLADRQFIPGWSQADRAPAYLLLAAGDTPDRYGLAGALELWHGTSAALYRVPEGVLGYTGFGRIERGLELTGALQLRPQMGRLTLEAGGLVQPVPLRDGAPPTWATVRGFADRTTLTGTTAGPVTLQPGAFELHVELRAGAPALSVMEGGALHLTSLTVLARRPDGPELQQQRAALVQATVVPNAIGASVGVRSEGPVPSDAQVGIDIYQVAGCAPAHYGWWAAPYGLLGAGTAFNLDLRNQQATALGLSPGALASQTWPVGDGVYRAFVMVKQGERFDSLPVLEFTLRGGEPLDVTPYPGSMFVDVQR